MKTKQIVYIVLGFFLIVGGAYWVVSSLVPKDQPSINTGNNLVDVPVQHEIENRDELQNSGFVGSSGQSSSISPSDSSTEEQSIRGADGEKVKEAVIDGVKKDSISSSGATSIQREKQAVDLLTPEEERRKKLNYIRDELKKIAEGDPESVDFNELDGLLIELQEMGDENGVVGGVSIPQLRKIITQANKIIQTSQNKGLNPGEDQNKKLKEEVETLQGLQQGIVVGHE